MSQSAVNLRKVQLCASNSSANKVGYCDSRNRAKLHWHWHRLNILTNKLSCCRATQI